MEKNFTKDELRNTFDKKMLEYLKSAIRYDQRKDKVGCYGAVQQATAINEIAYAMDIIEDDDFMKIGEALLYTSLFTYF